MRFIALLALLLVSGCAAKKPVVTQFVTPDCVKMRLVQECPLTDGKLDPHCKVHYEILCIKIKENK